MCHVEDKEGEPLFKVKVVEKGHDDLIMTGPTPKGKHHLWRVTCKITLMVLKVPEVEDVCLTSVSLSLCSCLGPDTGTSIADQSLQWDSEAVPSLPKRRGPVWSDHVCSDQDPGVCTLNTNTHR